MCILNTANAQPKGTVSPPPQTPGMASLQIGQSNQGLAPYGFRHEERLGAPITVKGKGYFGNLPTSSGDIATEISSHDEKGMGYPLLVPTLTKEERERLLNGEGPTDQIYDKAESWAKMRIKQGKSPFASPTELRIPRD